MSFYYISKKAFVKFVRICENLFVRICESFILQISDTICVITCKTKTRFGTTQKKRDCSKMQIRR